jgi:hypothetical protein
MGAQRRRLIEKCLLFFNLLCLLCNISGEADRETDPAPGQDAASVSGENSICLFALCVSVVMSAASPAAPISPISTFYSLPFSLSLPQFSVLAHPTNPASLASPRLDPRHQLDLHSNSLPDSLDSSSAFLPPSHSTHDC